MLVNQFHAARIDFVGGVGLQRPLEIVQNRQNSTHAVGMGEFQHVRLLPLGPFAKIVELGLAPPQAVPLTRSSPRATGRARRLPLPAGSGRTAGGGWIRRSVSAVAASALTGVDSGFLHIHTSLVYSFAPVDSLARRRRKSNRQASERLSHMIHSGHGFSVVHSHGTQHGNLGRQAARE
jgi:hypothetical protein